MAISYPLSMPTTVGPSNVTFYATHATSVSRSPFTFASQVQSYTGQMLGATVTLPSMKRAEAEEWVCFLLSLKGQYGTFHLGDPNGSTPRGSAGGTPLVNGAHTVGISTISIKGATANQTNWIRVGDYLSVGVGNTRRLHKALANANSSAGGIVSVDIWPDLREALADNAAVTLTSAKGAFRLSSNQQSWDINEISSYGITFDCEEAL